jgi:tripartite-type tricarboxylate transporter receptor subunit TctC
MNLAVESREVEGICGLSWSTIRTSRPDWIAGGRLNVLVQMALEKLPELADVPSALDLVADPGNKRVLELILLRQEMGRPIAAPPGVPAERVAVLRQAFDATMKDPDFLTDARRFQMEIDPLSADRIAGILAAAYGAPAPIVGRAAALVEPTARKEK